MNCKSTAKIVLTGGPGAGKTTAADLLTRELDGGIVLVPEAATMLFAGGFPRLTQPNCIRATQRAIFHVQRNLELVMQADTSATVLLCDRGTIDSAIYWPEGSDDFFNQVGTTYENELSQYHAVIFFETAAVGDLGITSNNRFRVESQEQAKVLDQQLYNIWKKHPRFFHIRHQDSFMQKINNAVDCMKSVIAGLD